MFQAHLLRSIRALLAVAGLITLCAPASAAPPATGDTASGRPPGSYLRVHATRSHMQCPLPGRNRRLISIDSPGEWEDTVDHQDELVALGRKVRWANERVLIYALETQHGTEQRLESPTRFIRLSQGVLYWPVRQRQLDTPSAASTGSPRAGRQSRPCVLAVIDRAFWQRIRVVPVQSSAS
jgi:hypothetical protein